MTNDITVLYWASQITADEMLAKLKEIEYPGKIIGGDCQ